MIETNIITPKRDTGKDADIILDLEIMAKSIQKELNKKENSEEGKGLSTNDFTNELKDKLEKLNTQDDKVVKGHYDEENKQIILELQSGNKIAIPVNDLLDDFYVKQTIDNLLKEQQEQINYLDKTLTRAEASGENINIKNSAEYPISNISIDTNIKQDSREGYNLLNFDVEQNSKVTVNDDGTITINGTGGFGLNFEEITLKTGVNYRQRIELVSGSITANNISNTFMAFNGSVWLTTNSDVITTPTEDTIKNSMWVNASTTFNNARIKIWGYQADTDKPYEQYGSMPSIEFPSEIKTPVGKQSFVSANENLLPVVNTSKTINGVTFTVNNDGSVTANGTATANAIFPLDYEITNIGKRPFKLKKGSYVFTDFVGDYTNYFTQISANDEDNKQYFINTGSGNGKFTIEKDIVYGAWIYIRKDVTVNNVVFKPMLVEGTEIPTNFRKGQSQFQDLDLNKELLGPIVDKEDGSYFENRWKRYAFTGNENFSYSNYNRFMLQVNDMDNYISTAYSEYQGFDLVFCNMYKPFGEALVNTSTSKKEYWITAWNDKNFPSIMIKNINYTTIDDFKAELKELYDNGTPVEMFYKLATPTYTKLTETQQAQWNKIKKMHTYEGVTNIYTINENGISPVINMKYVKSPKVVEENLQAQIDKLKNSIISMGGNV